VLGSAAIKLLRIEAFGIAVVMILVFALSLATIWLIGKVTKGIAVGYKK
jgi:hypothetical protein